MKIEFTKDELDAISESLNQAILDGFAEDDESPIVTALLKVRDSLRM